MVTNEAAVAALLNEARPALEPGWEVGEVGLGELVVRGREGRSYALLPAASAPLLPLLDGTRTLNEVAAELLHGQGKVRHRSILEAVVRLRAAGLLVPLAPEVDRYLVAEGRSLQPGGLAAFAGRVAALRLRLPLGLGAGRPRPVAAPGAGLLTAGLALLGLVSGLVRFQLWTLPGGGDALLASAPLAALLYLLAGLAAAVTLRELAAAALLVALGGRVRGVGVGLTFLVPHLATDCRDGLMVGRFGRMVLRGGTLLALAVPTALALWTGSGAIFYCGLGGLLVLLAASSPWWGSDLTRFAEEALGTRRIMATSRRYLARKLWRDLVRHTPLNREEKAMAIFATAGLGYLFVVALVAGHLLPAIVDGLTAAVLSRASSMVELAVALLLTAFVVLALLLGVLAIIGALAAALAQLATAGRRRQPQPAVISGEALPLEALVGELVAVPPFSELPPELVRSALSRGRIERHPVNGLIIRQGDPAAACFIIRSGVCRVVQEYPDGRSVAVAEMGPGHLFGEVALLHDSPRTATVMAASEVEVVAIDGRDFLELTRQSGVAGEQVIERVRTHLFLGQVELLRQLSPAGRATLMKRMALRRVAAGTEVVRQGETGESMFIIVQGQCRVLVNGEAVARLGPGDYFGEIALVTGAVRSATVRTDEESLLVELAAALYQEVIVREFAAGVAVDREIEARLEELSLL